MVRDIKGAMSRASTAALVDMAARLMLETIILDVFHNNPLEAAEV